MIRERTNSSPTVNETVYNTVTHGPHWLDLPFEARPREGGDSVGSYEPEYSYMMDESHGFGKDNICVSHEVTEHRFDTPVPTTLYVAGTTPLSARVIYSGDIRYGYQMLNTGYISCSILNHTLDTPYAEWDLPSYSAEALTSMWPGVTAEMSLVNSIYELKDFKHLPMLLRETDKTLKKLFDFTELNSLRRLLRNRNLRKKTLKEVVAMGTGNYLNYMFAVAPLVSDIAALRRAIARTDAAIKQLLEKQHEKHHSHFKKILKPDDVGAQGIVEFGDAVWQRTYHEDSYLRTTSLNGKIEYTASMGYAYWIPKMLLEHAQALGYLDSVGVNFNPAIIWNAIPFSFIVDWFWSISKTLNSMEGKLLSPIVNIETFCESVKYEVIDAIWHQPYQAYSNQSVSSGWGCSTVLNMSKRRIRKVYVRKPTLPSFVIPIRYSGLSLTEITLAGSLLGSFWSGGHSPNVNSSARS